MSTRQSVFAGTALLLLTTSLVRAQDKVRCTDLTERIRNTYGFKPSKLSGAEQSAKSESMDRFWDFIKRDPKRLLPCLRAAIEESNDRYFRFDASNLVADSDASPESAKIQVRAYTDVDLDDVNLRVWVTVLARRAMEGVDVSEAAGHWLAYPNATYALPEHSTVATKADGALFIYGSMDEALATPALAKIATQQNHPGRELALSLLMKQATPESLTALKQVDPRGLSVEAQQELREVQIKPKVFEPRAKPKTSRQEFVEAFQALLTGDRSKFDSLVEAVPDGERDVVAVLKPEDLPLVRKVRRLFISSCNPHAIDFYDSFTNILMTFVWKPERTR